MCNFLDHVRRSNAHSHLVDRIRWIDWIKIPTIMLKIGSSDWPWWTNRSRLFHCNRPDGAIHLLELLGLINYLIYVIITRCKACNSSLWVNRINHIKKSESICRVPNRTVAYLYRMVYLMYESYHNHVILTVPATPIWLMLVEVVTPHSDKLNRIP